MRDYIREVDESSVPFVAQLVQGWGYPRTIDPSEIKHSRWWTLDREDSERYESMIVGACWIHVMVAPGAASHRALHAIGHPVIRRHETMLTPSMLRRIVVLGELTGGTRLYAHVLPTSGNRPTADVVGRYLRMRGWEQDDLGAYIELGQEVQHG